MGPWVVYDPGEGLLRDERKEQGKVRGRLGDRRPTDKGEQDSNWPGASAGTGSKGAG